MQWYDISLIEEVESILKGGGGSSFADYVKSNPWEKISKEIGEEKTQKFIKIFCTINGIEYEKSILIDNKIKVSVSQFEKVFNESVRVKAILNK
jgi:hypothetical protein